MGSVEPGHQSIIFYARWWLPKMLQKRESDILNNSRNILEDIYLLKYF